MALEKGLEKELDELRFYRGTVVGLVIGIISTLLLSFKTLEKIIIFGGVGVLIIALIIWIALTFGINEKIKEIKGA